MKLAQLIEHVASEGCRRLAVYSLGGCGKTTLILETAYQTREQHLTRVVFWVPAVSQASFEQAYRQIGTLLRIPGIAHAKADVKEVKLAESDIVALSELEQQEATEIRRPGQVPADQESGGGDVVHLIQPDPGAR
ncbi:hypothetical protein M3J09_013845 [Ascochyta lentis]